jgi:predicted cobalt transporter CbtA
MKRLPVALLEDFEEAIISQAYPVFEVKDKNEILPQYLMMWFSVRSLTAMLVFWRLVGFVAVWNGKTSAT